MSSSSKDQEAEYIARKELEARRKAAKARRDQLAVEEKESLKELHWMHCPKCGAQLEEITFRGVKIDKCLECGGSYLDAGELEQLTGGSEWMSALRTFLGK